MTTQTIAPQTASWLFADHTMASINGTTIGTAIADLTQYTDAEGIAQATALAETLASVIRPSERVSTVTLAALMFARKAMVELTDSVAELDAELGSVVALMAVDSSELKSFRGTR